MQLLAVDDLNGLMEVQGLKSLSYDCTIFPLSLSSHPFLRPNTFRNVTERFSNSAAIHEDRLHWRWQNRVGMNNSLFPLYISNLCSLNR